MTDPAHMPRIQAMAQPAPHSEPPPEPAVAALYREHFRFVWRSLRRLGVRASSQEDALQEVFLVAHRKLAAFEGRSSHRAWLFGIALHVAREHRRRDARLTLLDPNDPEPRAPERNELDVRARIRMLDELLSTLSEEQREVFVMAEIEGFTAPELEAALGVPLNTVYSRLRLARAHFQRALARRRGSEGRGR